MIRFVINNIVLPLVEWILALLYYLLRDTLHLPGNIFNIINTGEYKHPETVLGRIFKTRWAHIISWCILAVVFVLYKDKIPW